MSLGDLTPIVGIGASAGGLDALVEFFSSVPTNLGAAYVVVQHLSPDFESHMVELLGRETAMPVRKIEHGLALQPNQVYLNSPRSNVLVVDGEFQVSGIEGTGGLNLPIDALFRSLSRLEKDRLVVGLILSGTGSDGSRGVADLSRSGALVLVQSPGSSEFDGMPRSALQTGLVDTSGTPGELANFVVQCLEEPDRFRQRCAERGFGSSADESSRAALLQLLVARFGIDFSLYKPMTFHRRLERRVMLTGRANLADYLEWVRGNAQEMDLLFRDLLVEVTEFFRDREAFVTLRSEILPQLVGRTQPKDLFRVWVAGCATGEEAYSLAMLVDEACAKDGRGVQFRVFATDVHQRSLETASAGVYSMEAVSRVPADLTQRYLERRQDLYHVSPRLRSSVLFATHDIAKDPPFTQCALVSCRNVLIYLLRGAQDRAIAQFHFALNRHGVLFLGPSESTGAHESEFDVVDQRWRMYRKRSDSRLMDWSRTHSSNSIRRVMRRSTAAVAARPFRSEEQLVVASVLHDVVEHHLPPALLVNESFELMHSFGEARRILAQPTGSPTLEVLRMVEGELRTALSAALHRVARRSEPVSVRQVTLDDGRLVDVVVTPYHCQERKLFLVQFPPADEPAVPTGPALDSSTVESAVAMRITELEQELLSTKATLESTVEDLEGLNEELQATNEELVAANEELQSTNEELHSVNEELYTVNAEHQRKIEELTELGADMDNLLKSTEIGTIFLDGELQVRSFTPAIASAFHLLERDLGRPIQHIAAKLDIRGIEEDSKAVIRTHEPSEREVRSEDGRVYLRRITPYRTGDGEVSGVVVTFVEVRQLEDVLRFERVVSSLEDVVWVVSGSDVQEVSFVNEAFERVWGISREALYARPGMWFEAVAAEDRAYVMRAFEQDLPQGTYDLTYRIRRPDGELRWIHALGHPVYRADGSLSCYAGVARDVTTETVLTQSLRSLLENSSDSVIKVALDDRSILFWNQGSEGLFGQSVVDAKLGEALGGPILDVIDEVLAEVAAGRPVLRLATEVRQRNGRRESILLSAWPTYRYGRKAALLLGQRAWSEGESRSPKHSAAGA